LSRIIIEGERLKEVVAKLEDARRSMDELIDTLEMLQDEEFQRELKESLSEAEKGEILSFGSVNELEKELTPE
jgi:hypothetical protein